MLRLQGENRERRRSHSISRRLLSSEMLCGYWQLEEDGRRVSIFFKEVEPRSQPYVFCRIGDFDSLEEEGKEVLRAIFVIEPETEEETRLVRRQ